MKGRQFRRRVVPPLPRLEGDAPRQGNPADRSIPASLSHFALGSGQAQEKGGGTLPGPAALLVLQGSPTGRFGKISALVVTETPTTKGGAARRPSQRRSSPA